MAKGIGGPSRKKPISPEKRWLVIQLHAQHPDLGPSDIALRAGVSLPNARKILYEASSARAVKVRVFVSRIFGFLGH